MAHKGPEIIRFFRNKELQKDPLNINLPAFRIRCDIAGIRTLS
jgi:hypothetical protein